MLKIKYVVIVLVYFVINYLRNHFVLLASLISSFGSFVCLLCLTWFLSNLLYQYIASHLFTKINSSKKCVLITGCDTGFGHLAAKHFNHLGFTVFAGCLDVNSQGAEELKQNPLINVVQLNVTKQNEIDDSYQQIDSYLADNDYQLHAIVNNAGISTLGGIEWGNLETLQNLWRVNTEGYLRICRKFLPMLRLSNGRVVNIGSVSAQSQMPMAMAYGISKTAIRSLTECLRREMADFNISVILIEPIAYGTLMLDHELILSKGEKNWHATDISIQQDYTTNYIDFLRFTSTISQLQSKFLQRKPFGSPMIVVKVIEQSVVSGCPRNVVVPGTLLVSLPIYFITGILPVDLIDMGLYVQDKLLNSPSYRFVLNLVEQAAKSLIKRNTIKVD